MTPEMFRKLAALGLSHEQMAGVLEIFEADADSRKEKVRLRVQKWREKRSAEEPCNVTKHDATLHNGSRAGDARVEDNLQTKNQAGKKERKKDSAPAAPTPASELEAVLDEEHARAVVDHRQRLRKPLTAYAARKLAREFAKAPDPNAAADAMIVNGWQGFELSWLENRRTPSRHATSPPGRMSPAVAGYHQFQAMKRDEQPSRTIDHSDAERLQPDEPRLRALVGDIGSSLRWPDGSGHH
jgi:hypothetical protein